MPIPCQMRPVTFVTRLRAALVLGALCPGAALLAGCGGSALESGARVVNIGEKDFRITAPRRIAAGDVVLRVANKGPDSHELLVIRADGELPLRTDNVTMDEESLEKDEAGVLEPGAAHDVRLLKVHLTPGRYVLLCNMQGHYLGGMHAVIEVS